MARDALPLFGVHAEESHAARAAGLERHELVAYFQQFHHVLVRLLVNGAPRSGPWGRVYATAKVAPDRVAAAAAEGDLSPILWRVVAPVINEAGMAPDVRDLRKREFTALVWLEKVAALATNPARLDLWRAGELLDHDLRMAAANPDAYWMLRTARGKVVTPTLRHALAACDYFGVARPMLPQTPAFDAANAEADGDEGRVPDIAL